MLIGLPSKSKFTGKAWIAGRVEEKGEITIKEKHKQEGFYKYHLRL